MKKSHFFGDWWFSCDFWCLLMAFLVIFWLGLGTPRHIATKSQQIRFWSCCPHLCAHFSKKFAASTAHNHLPQITLLPSLCPSAKFFAASTAHIHFPQTILLQSPCPPTPSHYCTLCLNSLSASSARPPPLLWKLVRARRALQLMWV